MWSWKHLCDNLLTTLSCWVYFSSVRWFYYWYNNYNNPVVSQGSIKNTGFIWKSAVVFNAVRFIFFRDFCAVFFCLVITGLGALFPHFLFSGLRYRSGLFIAWRIYFAHKKCIFLGVLWAKVVRTRVLQDAVSGQKNITRSASYLQRYCIAWVNKCWARHCVDVSGAVLVFTIFTKRCNKKLCRGSFNEIP